MKIPVTVKQKSGRYELTIADASLKTVVGELTGKGTITRTELEALESLGHEIEYTEYAMDYINGKL